MAIKLRNKINPEFNMTSMADMVFLLLIFFVITSTMVSPNVINIYLPKSTSGKQSTNRNIEVYINEKKEYFVNPTEVGSAPIPYEELLPALEDAVANDQSDSQAIVLRSDKTVPIESVVILMDVLNSLNEKLEEESRYKIVLATEPL